jgi:DNA-3-methyladenine glycosylase
MDSSKSLLNNMWNPLESLFFQRDVLEVAPDLLGKNIVIQKDNQKLSYPITEVEAYRGEEDKACHANKGRTKRTEIMYSTGGHIYVYLIYGMYWMLNIVTERENIPQAVLIRGILGFNGPGKLTKQLGIDGTYYGEDICSSNRIWITDVGIKPKIKMGRRIGINYAGVPWVDMPWRYKSDI